MERRKASDRMAECIIDMLHEYKHTIERLNSKIEALNSDVGHWKHRTQKAVDDCDKATDTLGEIAEIIAGITEHKEDGSIYIFLSDIKSEDAVKQKRLFDLLGIPMTAEQIKGDDIDED